MTTLPELKKNMEEQHKNFRAIVYPGVGHAFFNDKNTFAYNAEAAAKAWEEVKKFLKTV
jgi:carboxymethylenebutenolidase